MTGESDTDPYSGGSLVSSQFEISTTAALATLSTESKAHNALLVEALAVIKDYGSRLTQVEIEQAREREKEKAVDTRLGVIESALSNKALTWPKLLTGLAALVATIVGLGIYDRFPPQ